MRWMRANVLSIHDPDVEHHLTRLDIPLSVIGIRWYRLLFGREFAFHDLLTLWDAIFADNFELIKYLPAAMLISVRRTSENNGNSYFNRKEINFQFILPFQSSPPTLSASTSV